MTLPVPILDDRKFEELVEEAKKLIPVYAPGWSDHNAHDPGITFIELFAWLVEMQLYRADSVLDAHLRKYLELLRTRPRPGSPSKADIVFSSDEPVSMPRGSVVWTSSPDPVEFETDEEVDVLPLELAKAVSLGSEVGKGRFYAFGSRPARGETLLLGFAPVKGFAGKVDDLAGKKMTLGVSLYEDDLPRRGRHGDERPAVHPSAAVGWAYWGDAGWTPLAVSASDPNITALCRPGRVWFRVPTDFKNGRPPGTGRDLLWIQLMLEEPGYEVAPIIDKILVNAAGATQGRTVSSEQPTPGAGLPWQKFITGKRPVVPGSMALEVDGRTWAEVYDFDASGPEDRCYRLDAWTGEITFGDGVRGAVPPRGTGITVKYRYHCGGDGNVAAGTITESGSVKVMTNNPFPATGGEVPETIEEAFIRFRRDAGVPYTAVTAEDFEHIAVNTPGLRLARAKALVPGAGENTVTVVVIPWARNDNKRPVPSGGFKKTVCRHLDMHRLITTGIKVEGPDYVRVSVSAEITVRPGSSPENVKRAVAGALGRFLSPVRRGPGDNAWPFGRTVYRSEVYEAVEGAEGVGCITRLSLKAEEGDFSYRDGDVVIGRSSVAYPGEHSIEVLERRFLCKGASGE